MAYFNIDVLVSANLTKDRKIMAIVNVKFCDFDSTWELKKVVEANLFKGGRAVPYLTLEKRDVMGIMLGALNNSSEVNYDILTAINYKNY